MSFYLHVQTHSWLHGLCTVFFHLQFCFDTHSTHNCWVLLHFWFVDPIHWTISAGVSSWALKNDFLLLLYPLEILAVDGGHEIEAGATGMLILDWLFSLSSLTKLRTPAWFGRARRGQNVVWCKPSADHFWGFPSGEPTIKLRWRERGLQWCPGPRNQPPMCSSVSTAKLCHCFFATCWLLLADSWPSTRTQWRGLHDDQDYIWI